MKSNDDILNDLRVNTSLLERMLRTEDSEEAHALASAILDDFVALDLSLLEGGQLPGAWGASKLSKSKM